MKTIKFVLFLIGLFLVTYVGGVPGDSKNFFITQILFFTPIMLEYSRMLTIQSALKYLVYLIWFAGIIVLVVNILGIFGFIDIISKGDSFVLIFSQEHYMFKGIKLEIYDYLLISMSSVSSLFIGNFVYEYNLIKPEMKGVVGDVRT